MKELTLADVLDLRAYEREREARRAAVIELKRKRRVGIGPIVTVVFENRATMLFQVQEMARAEKMITDEQVQHELDVYNPLLPGPGEISMTLFVELTSDAELRHWLPRLVGIERSVLLRVGGAEVRASVDPAHDAQLTRAETTASVHYVRIALDEPLAAGFAAQPAAIAIDHPEYSHSVALSEETRESLAADWRDEEPVG